MRRGLRSALVFGLLGALGPLSCLAEIESLGPGEFVIVGVRGDEARDQALVWVDLADPSTQRTLIERAPDQRLVDPVFTLDGAAIDVLRQRGDELELVRVREADASVQVLARLPRGSYTQLALRRMPDGRLVGVAQAGPPPSPGPDWRPPHYLIEASAEGTATVRSLAGLQLPAGDWSVTSPAVDELVFFASAPLHQASPPLSTTVAVSTDGDLVVRATLASDSEVSARCVPSPAGTQLACALLPSGATAGAAQIDWFVRTGPQLWSEGVRVGPGAAAVFSADGSTVVMASAVRRTEAPALAVLGEVEVGVEPWQVALTNVSPAGERLLHGACDRDLIAVDSGERVQIESHTCVDGDEPKPGVFSNDGAWLYRGQCLRPTEPDTYDCAGSLVSVNEARRDCAVDPERPYDTPEGCDVRVAVGLSEVAVRP